MTPSMLIERAVYLGNFTILFETIDGEVGIIDFKPLLNGNMGAFECLRNEDVFKKFYQHTYVLTWDVSIQLMRDNHQVSIALRLHACPLLFHSVNINLGE